MKPLDFPGKGSIACRHARAASGPPTPTGNRRGFGWCKRRDRRGAGRTEVPMPKLTDTQLVILFTAAQRDDGAVLPLPTTIKAKGGAASAVLKVLLGKKLVAEVPARAQAPAWRGAKGKRLGLVITDAGRRAIGIEVAEPVSAAPPKSKRSRQAAASAASPRAGTKQTLLVDLFRRDGGATIDEAVTATGWQPHSVRGAISGTLKKKLGLAVASENVEGRGRVYRIAG
ncbi:MAG: DUF3489 domain-containing protein [Alphaproteobacteria bacterium]